MPEEPLALARRLAAEAVAAMRKLNAGAAVSEAAYRRAEEKVAHHLISLWVEHEPF